MDDKLITIFKFLVYKNLKMKNAKNLKAFNPWSFRDNHIFNDLFYTQKWHTRYGQSDWLPMIDVIEHDKSYQLQVDIPGLKKENIKVRFEYLKDERYVHDEDKLIKYLIIEGEKHKVETGTFHRYERYRGKFIRYFVPPPDANCKDIEIELYDGVLDIKIKKI